MSASEPEREEAITGAMPSVSPDFRAVFDSAPTPLLVVSPPDWIIVAANDARL